MGRTFQAKGNLVNKSFIMVTDSLNEVKELLKYCHLSSCYDGGVLIVEQRSDKL